MKKIQFIMTIAFIISIVSFNVFAVEPNIGLEQNAEVEQNTGLFPDRDKQGKIGEGEKDPIKRLEKRKELIENGLKEGKITKEKADEMIDRIDKHIAKIKEFDSLSLPQKKERLSEKVKSRIEYEIKNGKITKEEGEQILKEFNKNLENWDGKEFPKVMKKSDKCDKYDKYDKYDKFDKFDKFEKNKE